MNRENSDSDAQRPGTNVRSSSLRDGSIGLIFDLMGDLSRVSLSRLLGFHIPSVAIVLQYRRKVG